jgi:hypothetical protein
MRCFAKLAAVATLGSSMALAGPLAAEPATAGAFQFGAGFRYGFDFEEGDLNPWGTGLGIDLGYTTSSAVYLGGNFEYFFGTTEDTPALESTARIWQLMLEGGYDVGAGDKVVLRPKLEAGIASHKLEFCVTGEPCYEDSITALALAPGGTFLLLTSGFSLTLDVRYELVFAEGEMLNGLILSAGIGF